MKENIYMKKYYCKIDKYMNAVEEFFIYLKYQKKPQLLLNNQLTFNSNYLYDNNKILKILIIIIIIIIIIKNNKKIINVEIIYVYKCRYLKCKI